MPTTIEEYEQVFVGSRDQDADGDGDPSNEIPMGGTYGSMVCRSLQFMFSCWGIPANDKYVSIDDNNEVFPPAA